MKESKTPLISQMEKTRRNPKVLGMGNEMGHTEIRRFENEGSHGNPNSYVEKPVLDENIARETLVMWQELKRLGLPVVDFLKVVKKRDRETGKDEYFIAMQDLSNGGP